MTDTSSELAASAIWHRDRCTWVGPAGTRTHAALGPDLYDGTAGVGLYLAHAAVTLGEPRLVRPALGAFRHALAHAGQHEGGLYRGPLGVAVAAARAARVLDSEELHAGAARVLTRWRRSPPGDAVDLAEGAAGAIMALLALDAPDAAARLGERVLTRAAGSPDGWLTPSSPRQVILCGLFRGAAGIGLALHELAAVTGDERFRTAAERAFAYEASWWRRAGGAADLRGVLRGVPPDAPIPASATWCHGAAGALVARVRAGQDFARELEAVRTAEPPRDPWLCHGAAGLADARLYAGDDDVSAPAVTDGPPGLFTGLAGVGLLQLRLIDQEIPTALIV